MTDSLKLLTTAPAKEVIAHLLESPNSSLPWSAATSTAANRMHKAGWLKREKEGTVVKWDVTKALENVVLTLMALEKLNKDSHT